MTYHKVTYDYNGCMVKIPNNSHMDIRLEWLMTAHGPEPNTFGRHMAIQFGMDCCVSYTGVDRLTGDDILIFDSPENATTFRMKL